MLPGNAIRRPRVQLNMNWDSHAEKSHGSKNLIVLHETISPDHVGLSDILGVYNYLLHSTPYEIHVITDVEGYSAAVAVGNESLMLDHCASGSGNVNERSIGIEQVSMASWRSSKTGYWLPGRIKELEKTARWCTYIIKRSREGAYGGGTPIRPIWDRTCTNGIVGHWDVTARYLGGQGHTDCKYPGFPMAWVERRVQQLLRDGWR